MALLLASWRLEFSLRPMLCLLLLLPGWRLCSGQQTPIMGWSSWNHFKSHVTDQIVREQADALVGTGLRDAGYRYVLIDDGWQGERDSQGQLHPNAGFPDMPALARYLHERGLRLGIYSSPGNTTCAGFVGSALHEEQDSRTFAGWGVDVLKYDMCSLAQAVGAQAPNDPAAQQELVKAAYMRMHRALERSGRSIVLTISNHGLLNVSAWAAEVGAVSWRTTEDVQDSYAKMSAIGFSQAGLARFVSPGHWIDPDMLEAGNGGMTTSEYRTQISLWAMLAAPLVAGHDLTRTDVTTLALLKNKRLLEIDQDELGRAGDRVWVQGQLEVWHRILKDGSSVLGVFNRAPVYRGLDSAEVDVSWKDLGLRRPVRLDNVWTGQQHLGADRLQLLVLSHDAVLLHLIY